jgi:hypothetical protein
MKGLFWVWQFPQHVLALVLLWVVRRKLDMVHRYKTSKVFWHRRLGWGISLGQYILLDLSHDDVTLQHEYGHAVQSKMLGPLYLIIVGIPSFSMNMLSLLFWKLGYKGFAYRYYQRWPETWADRLGGVRERKSLG